MPWQKCHQTLFINDFRVVDFAEYFAAAGQENCHLQIVIFDNNIPLYLGVSRNPDIQVPVSAKKAAASPDDDIALHDAVVLQRDVAGIGFEVSLYQGIDEGMAAVHIGNAALDTDPFAAVDRTIDSGNIIIHLYPFTASNGTIHSSDTPIHHRMISHADAQVNGMQASYFAVVSDFDPAVDSVAIAPDGAISTNANTAVDGFGAMVYGFSVPDMDAFIDTHIAPGKNQANDRYNPQGKN